MSNNFQRIGSISNAHVGNDFEGIAQRFFLKDGLSLRRGFSAAVGVSSIRKSHRFDLGSDDPPTLVECKSHTWTSTGNIPSAKLTVWNEAMYYFHIAPPEFRKILFVLKHNRQEVSLATYYLKTYSHLIPPLVEVWEYDVESEAGVQLR